MRKLTIIAILLVAPSQANYFCQGEGAYICEDVKPAPFMYIPPTYIEPHRTPQQIDESLKKTIQ